MHGKKLNVQYITRYIYSSRAESPMTSANSFFVDHHIDGQICDVAVCGAFLTTCNNGYAYQAYMSKSKVITLPHVYLMQ